MLRRFGSDRVFVASAVALVLTSFLARRFPNYSASDFKTVYLLFLMFSTTESLKTSGFFEYISSKLGGRRKYGLVLSTAVLSSLVTNDAALFVTVPITASLDLPRIEKEKLVILETVVANGFSSLTPFGNPQNIFIHVHYSLKLFEITRSIYPLPFVVLASALFITGGGRIGCGRCESEKFKKSWLLDVLAFSVVALAVVDLVPDTLTVLSLLIVSRNPRTFKNVDYPLLFTFLCFFGFTDNLKSMIDVTLEGSNSVFFLTLGLSQFMSNVPAALTVSDFTSDWRALLWGANVGGFGTIVASMANLIALRIYRFDVRRFTVYNLVFLGLGTLLWIYLIS